MAIALFFYVMLKYQLVNTFGSKIVKYLEPEVLNKCSRYS